MRSVFEILEIELTNDFAAVKSAYHKKALELHPDKNPGDSTAKEAFQQVQGAFEKVCDPEKLNRYFCRLQEQLPQIRHPQGHRAEFTREFKEYMENKHATEISEGERINRLYQAGFPADPTKTGFVDIYVPLHFDVVEVASTENAEEITPGLYVCESGIKEEILIGMALPLPTKPNSSKYNPDDLKQYQLAGINFANVANALTKLSHKNFLQVGCSIEEAYGIIHQLNREHFRVMIIKVSVPAQSLSAQREYGSACFNAVYVGSRDIKTFLLRRGIIINPNQIEKANFVPDDGYSGFCSVCIYPCDVHRNIFSRNCLGNTDALNPNYVNPSQERPRSPTRTTDSLFSSTAASSDGTAEDTNVTPGPTRR